MACRIFITSCRTFCCGTEALTALYRLSSFGTWALELWPTASRVHRPSMWALWILVSWPGIKLVFLALQDGFLLLDPQGSPWFPDIAKPLYSSDKSNFVLCMILLVYSYVQFVDILLRIFASMSISDIGLWFFFFVWYLCLVLVIRMRLALYLEWAWKYSFLYAIFGNRLRRTGLTSSLSVW